MCPILNNGKLCLRNRSSAPLDTTKAKRRGTNQQQNDILATDHTKFHHNFLKT